MKTIKEISDYWSTPDNLVTKTREAARAILFDENNLTPLLYVSKHNYHKLPGGWVEEGENQKTALLRECLEEVGCTVEIKWEVWKIVEFRARHELKQISYCYWGNITSVWLPTFTEKEKEQWFVIIRVGLDEAISMLKNDEPTNYEWKFIQQRDISFLKQCKKLLK